MTFLQLVQRTRQECGIAGDGPTTTSGQTREMKRLCDWVSQAWVEIQEEHSDFLFMRKQVTFNTVNGQQQYHVGTGLDIDVSDFASWRRDSFMQYLESAGIATQIILSEYYDYTEFRNFYLLGSRQLVTGRPLYMTIAPDKSVLFGFTPNDIYVTKAEYYCVPQVLASDDDTPTMPSRFHMAIVYRAMQKYGLFEVANEQIQAGKEGYSQQIARLREDQLPMVRVGASMI